MTNDEVFARAYADHNPMLRRFLSKRVADQHLVEDLLQETWTKAWGAIGRARPEGPGGLEPWLVQIAKNTLTDQWRRASLRPVVPAGDNTTFAHHPANVVGPEEAAVAADEWSADLAACERPQHRTVLRMRCELEMSVLETAAALGVPPGTVRSRMHYARRAVVARRAAS